MSGYGLPPTMLLQIAVALTGTAIGIAGLWIARRAPAAAPVHRAAWHATGAAFLLMGCSALTQNAFGIQAIRAGSGSIVWNRYLDWAPAFNYSRNVLEVGFLALLVVCILRRGSPDPLQPGTVWATLLLGLLCGFALGGLEGALDEERHYYRIAVTDAGLFATWALILSAAVLADVVDRWLLLALVLAAVPLPLNALWFFWLTRAETGLWIPRPVDMQAYRLVLHLLMLASVAQRLHLARRGVPVHGLGGSLAPERSRA